MARQILFTLGVLAVLTASVQVQAQTAADCDFDGSGDVDFADFLVFAAAYGSSTAEYDLDGSGLVDFPDFLAFVGFYGQEAPTGPEKEISVTLAGDTTITFVYIQPGTFTMGSSSSESGRYSIEGPQHQVTISKGFHLGKYEVTQGQWQAVMGTTPWADSAYVQANPDHPAVYVSWNDAQVFIHKLNVAAGDSLYRLPSV